MKKLVLHIPHASPRIPMYEGFKISQEEINAELKKLTNWYIEDLFDSPGDIPVLADFSRIFCDVEKSPDEVISSNGLGVLYEKTDDGKPMRDILPKLRVNILKDFYSEHHQRFKNAVTQRLKKNSRALIIDCHSFPAIPLKRDQNQQLNRPDICIGTDPFHSPKYMADFSVDFFTIRGYNARFNDPYTGTFVPPALFRKEYNVFSLMIGINRSLYMNESTLEKTEKYDGIKSLIAAYLSIIRDFYMV